ncbi:MAG: MaoC family dehydratase [Pseudomonadota bacterium]
MTGDLLTFEDFPAGKEYPLGPVTVEAQDIIDFATEFDPQPFHVDPDSQQAAQVGGLIASGWHSCALLMRMMCDSYLLRSASDGSSGLDEVRWLKPVRPGDTLSGTSTVVSSRISKSNPKRGIIVFRYEVQNQHGDVVMEVSGSGMVATAAAAQDRAAAAGDRP